MHLVVSVLITPDGNEAVHQSRVVASFVCSVFPLAASERGYLHFSKRSGVSNAGDGGNSLLRGLGSRQGVWGGRGAGRMWE